MIKYNLKCENSHVFEAWFKNSAAYDEQSERNIITCTLCGSVSVTKAPMAPSVPKKGSAPKKSDTQMESEQLHVATAMNALREIRKAVEENCDYVGDKFAEEARKIHYGETEERGIYGQTTLEEKQELEEEGVELATIPWVPSNDA
jgi:hypothetical protein